MNRKCQISPCAKSDRPSHNYSSKCLDFVRKLHRKNNNNDNAENKKEKYKQIIPDKEEIEYLKTLIPTYLDDYNKLIQEINSWKSDIEKLFKDFEKALKDNDILNSLEFVNSFNDENKANLSSIVKFRKIYSNIAEKNTEKNNKILCIFGKHNNNICIDSYNNYIIIKTLLKNIENEKENFSKKSENIINYLLKIPKCNTNSSSGKKNLDDLDYYSPLQKEFKPRNLELDTLSGYSFEFNDRNDGFHFFQGFNDARSQKNNDLASNIFKKITNLKTKNASSVSGFNTNLTDVNSVNKSKNIPSEATRRDTKEWDKNSYNILPGLKSYKSISDFSKNINKRYISNCFDSKDKNSGNDLLNTSTQTYKSTSYVIQQPRKLSNKLSVSTNMRQHKVQYPYTKYSSSTVRNDENNSQNTYKLINYEQDNKNNLVSPRAIYINKANITKQYVHKKFKNNICMLNGNKKPKNINLNYNLNKGPFFKPEVPIPNGTNFSGMINIAKSSIVPKNYNMSNISNIPKIANIPINVNKSTVGINGKDIKNELKKELEPKEPKMTKNNNNYLNSEKKEVLPMYDWLDKGEVISPIKSSRVKNHDIQDKRPENTFLTKLDNNLELAGEARNKNNNITTEIIKTTKNSKFFINNDKDLCVGLDLGNTECKIGIINQNTNETQLLYFENNNYSIPTLVSFERGKKNIEIGYKAEKLLVTNPSQTIFNITRFFGKKYSEVIGRQDLWPFKIFHDEFGTDRPYLKLNHAHHKNKTFYFEDILSIFLIELFKYMFEKIELESSCDNNQNQDKCSEIGLVLVISVPNNYTYYQRELLKHIIKDKVFPQNFALGSMDEGNLYGKYRVILKNIKIESCSSLACLSLPNNIPNNKDNILVLNVDGGSVNVSIISRDFSPNKIFQVKAMQGLPLGGEDLVDSYVCDCLSKLPENISSESINNPTSLAKLRRSYDATRLCLLRNTQADINIKNLIDNYDFNFQMTRADYEKLSFNILRRIKTLIKEALKKSELTENEIDDIIITGTSNRINKLRQIIIEIFGQNKKVFNKLSSIGCNDLDNDFYIVAGAALQAININNTFDIYSFNDLSPFNLGVEGIDGRMNLFISKGCKLPLNSNINIKLKKENPLKINIYEGDEEIANKNKIISVIPLDDSSNILNRDSSNNEYIDLLIQYELTDSNELYITVFSNKSFIKKILCELNIDDL